MNSPEQERSGILARLDSAVCQIQGSGNPGILSGGTLSIGYAIRGARDLTGIAAIPGGISFKNEKFTPEDQGTFGSDEYIARIILTAMKFDHVVRCAATILFSEEILNALEDMFLECCSFDRSKQPTGTSSMDWGIASCCRDGVPDVIFNRGMNQESGIIHFFGEDPVAVANNIIICSNRI
jgi:hydroxymethylpyrimidine/phosphomethylpyrimidine kinase